MKLVVIESPRGDEVMPYVRACIEHSIKKGEAPYMSTLVDENIHAAWGAKADLRVFYVDLGWSRGMKTALTKYRLEGLRYTFRVIGKPWSWLLAPLSPEGFDVKELKEEDYILRALNEAPLPTGHALLAGVSGNVLQKLEADGFIEKDEWPNGEIWWSIKELSTDRVAINPPAPSEPST